MKIIYLLPLFIINLFYTSSCDAPKKKGFSGSTQELGTEGSNTAPGAIGTEIDGRPADEVLCEKGPKVAGVDNQNFAKQFALICEGKTTNAVFKEILANAYTGEGDPIVKVLKSETGELFVTNFASAHALKVKLPDPTMFADLKAFDVFASGIRRETSELVVTVESRETFPGKGVVERQILNYDLRKAQGAGIHDIRRTEFNTYLLSETSRDVTIAAEALLDVENSRTYHEAKGLLLGIKAQDGYSYLVFITDLTIKNRIDPARMQETMIKLNTESAKMLYDYVKLKTQSQ